jgi:hypothetical protein
MIGFASCRNYPRPVSASIAIAKNARGLDSLLGAYRDNPRDSLKLKAAYLLISSLKYGRFRLPEDKYDGVFDSIAKIPDNPGRYGLFEKLLIDADFDDTGSVTGYINDKDTISSSFIKEDIELSFREWQAFPAIKRAGFEEFCAYILPYRATDEPLEEDARRHLCEKYHWAKQMLLSGKPLRMVVDTILRSVHFATSTAVANHFHSPMSISQVEKSRFGVCSDGVNYFVNVLRAIGLPASYDYIKQWGNHHLTGHSWIYVKYSHDDYAVNIMPNGEDVRKTYKGESIPKVFRAPGINQSMTPLIDADVTALYTKTITYTVPKTSSGPDTPYLCIFNSEKTWNPVQKGEFLNGNYVWKNVGTNVTYIVGNFKDGKFVQAAAPFFVNNNRQIQYFIPDNKQLTSATLLRKYGLVSPRNHQKADWLENLNGLKIFASNDSNFRVPTLLYQIENLGSYQQQKVIIRNSKTFRFIKIDGGGNPSYLSRLVLFGPRLDTLKLKCLDKWPAGFYHGKIEDWFDASTETYFGGKKMVLRFSLEKKSRIGSIEYQARTDDNQIRLGDKYQLLYWWKGWNSLGEKIATDTALCYTNIPNNALLLLKDLTRGVEVHVFENQHGKQKWLGFER